MVKVLNERDSVMAMEPTPRVKRLMETFAQLKPVVELDRERINTRVMKETDGEPMVIRRAKAFCAIVREMPVNIAPDELFVGYIDASWAGAQVKAEVGAPLELILNHNYEGGRPFIISEEDERELREEIIPYWKGQLNNWGRTWASRLLDVIPEDKYEVLSPPRIVAATQHYGHETINYEKVLKEGFLGVKREAEERLAGLDYSSPDELKKAPFLRGVVMAMEAASEIGSRFAARARKLAAEEKDTRRRAELMKIAEICGWVPAHPARTFYEALQSYWFAFILQYWETLHSSGTSIGRPDQYLYPYYEKDIKEGRITREEAQELIDCWLMRFQHVDWGSEGEPFTSSGVHHPFGGHRGGHISVGGYKADSSDATNELSYMFIEGKMHVRYPVQTLSLQVHSRTPEDLLIKACQLCSLGTGQPQFENMDVIVPGLLTRVTGGPPVALEEARCATSNGCQELETVGSDGLNLGGYVNAAAALELALNNGVSRLSRQEVGLKTGDPRQFKSFAEVMEAYRKQFAVIVERQAVSSNIKELNLAEMHPTVFHSALIADCIEKGMSREEGGARYNAGPGIYAVGVPDVADSLAAIKRVVFEEKKTTMARLCDALDSDFEGYEDIRQVLLKSPKYGNDDDYVDELMASLAHEWAVACRKQRNMRGGCGVPGLQAFIVHVSMGKAVGALPSGRRAGEALSDGASPCTGNDINGPTAVLKSLSKVNNAEQNMTDILNMSLDPVIFKDRGGFKRLADFIRTLVDLKVQMVQFNVVSADELRAAQKEPDRYRNLVVRVAGWCAYFVNLTRGLQDAIIARTEHKL